MGIRQISKVFDNMSRIFAIGAGYALFGLAILIGIDVVGRKLFNAPLQGSDEIGGYIMAVLCAFGFSYALTQRAHVRLNILFPKLPKLLQSLLSFSAFSLLTFYSYMMFWQMITVLKDSVRYQAVAPTALQTPLQLPQFIVVVGLGWFALHITIYFLMSLKALTKNQVPEFFEEPAEDAKDISPKDPK